MPNFGTRFVDGWERATDVLALAVVPFLTGLLAFDKISTVLAFRGGHVGLKLFAVPMGIVDVWQFVSVPNVGVSVGPGSLLAAVVGLVVQSVLGAGYFGSIRDALADGEFDFAWNVSHYFSRFFVFQLVLVVVGLVGGVLAVIPLFVVVAFVAWLVLGYLFFATPYLIVLRDLDVVTAAWESYDLAVRGSPYFDYVVGYSVFVLVTSIFATGVVVNFGPLGLLLGVVAGAPVGLALNVATMRFVADVDENAPDLGSWDADGGDSPPGDLDDGGNLDDDVQYGLDDDALGDD